MPITEIVERADDEVLVQYTDRFFRKVFKETGPIGPAFNGKYASAIVIATDVQLDETTAGQLETAIEGIAGVYYAKHVAQGRIPLDRVPADTAEMEYKLYLQSQFGFDVKGTPTGV